MTFKILCCYCYDLERSWWLSINFLCICLHSDCTRTIHCTLAVDLNDAVEYWTPVPFKSLLFWKKRNIFLTIAFNASLLDKNKSRGKTNLVGYSTCKQLEITVQCRNFVLYSLFMPKRVQTDINTSNNKLCLWFQLLNGHLFFQLLIPQTITYISNRTKYREKKNYWS